MTVGSVRKPIWKSGITTRERSCHRVFERHITVSDRADFHSAVDKRGIPTSNRRSRPVRRTTMEILRAGTRASGKGPDAWFTGSVRIDPLFNPFDAERVQGAQVTFEPG